LLHISLVLYADEFNEIIKVCIHEDVFYSTIMLYCLHSS